MCLAKLQNKKPLFKLFPSKAMLIVYRIWNYIFRLTWRPLCDKINTAKWTDVISDSYCVVIFGYIATCFPPTLIPKYTVGERRRGWQCTWPSPAQHGQLYVLSSSIKNTKFCATIIKDISRICLILEKVVYLRF